MKNTYFLKIQGFPDDYSCEKVCSKIKDCVESIINISIGFDKSFLVAVIFMGTPEKCVEELSRQYLMGEKLLVHLIKPFPIFQNFENAPNLYEDGSNPYPYFPELQCGENPNNTTENNNNNAKYSHYNEINPPSKVIVNNSNSYRMPPANDPSTLPWSSKS